MSRHSNNLKRIKEAKRRRREMRGASQEMGNAGMKADGGMNVRINTASLLESDIAAMKARLLAFGRDELFDMMGKGLFGFLMRNRIIKVKILNAQYLRHETDGLTDGEVAEYLIAIITSITANLVDRHGPGFFEQFGESRYTLSLPEFTWAKAKETIRFLREDATEKEKTVPPASNLEPENLKEGPTNNVLPNLEAVGRRDMLADIEKWKTIVKARGRDVVIDDLFYGHVFIWLGEDVDHKLYIKSPYKVEVRELLRSYSDAELGEWFSLMTGRVLAEAMLQVGMAWKQFGPNAPVILADIPRLGELRAMFDLA